MPIKPIDYNVILPKSQELNSHKINEQIKYKNTVDGNIIQREKIINENKRKVLDTEKTEYVKINKDSESKKEHEKNKKNKEKNMEKELKKKKKSFSGHRIDIQV